MAIALLPQCLRSRILQLQLGLKIRRGDDLRRHGTFPFQPGSYRIVGELRFVADQGAIKIARFDMTVVADHELDDDRSIVLTFQQRGKAGR